MSDQCIAVNDVGDRCPEMATDGVFCAAHGWEDRADSAAKLATLAATISLEAERSDVSLEERTLWLELRDEAIHLRHHLLGDVGTDGEIH